MNGHMGLGIIARLLMWEVLIKTTVSIRKHTKKISATCRIAGKTP